MSARECAVQDCHVAADRSADGQWACGICFDYWRIHGHWPDETPQVCPFCATPASPVRLSAIPDGGDA